MNYLRYFFTISLCLIISIAFTYCGGKTTQNNTQTETETEEKADTAQATENKEDSKKNSPPLQTDRKYNDMARLMAGLPAEEGSVVAKHTETDTWKQFAQVAESQWKAMSDVKIPKMRTWAEAELKAPNAEKGVLFYPFGGADFLHAGIFFPEAEEIVMMGLEPIGNMPDFDKIAQKGSLGGYFNAIRRSLATILQYSFFKTNDMAVDFTGRVQYDLDGTLPILLFFMARTNHKILYYEKVAINAEGKLVKAGEAQPIGGKEPIYYGTKIDYQRADKPEEHKTLYYFSVNLGNDAYDGKGGLKQRKDLFNYIESLDIQATYLKSASYLMYKPYFYDIRDLILKKSKYLLQDDSGMPLKNFLNEQWDLTFFGVYVGPIALFGNFWQNDMKQAYLKKEQVRPLPFGIGYQFREGTSNLMLAKKKE
jgi:hypothetical protein